MTFDELPRRLTPADALRRVRKLQLLEVWPERPELPAVPVRDVLGPESPEVLDGLRRWLERVVFAVPPPTEVPPDLADDPIVCEMFDDAESFRVCLRVWVNLPEENLPVSYRGWMAELRAGLLARNHPWVTGAEARPGIEEHHVRPDHEPRTP
jgi:hypothetical protein